LAVIRRFFGKNQWVWLPGPCEWPWELDPESLPLDDELDDPESDDVDEDEEPDSDFDPESDFVAVDVDDEEEEEPLESVL
jgi:hypothetical protein